MCVEHGIELGANVIVKRIVVDDAIEREFLMCKRVVRTSSPAYSGSDGLGHRGPYRIRVRVP